MLVRFNQPGIQRYIDEGNSWMLSKTQAGGGALLNLGFHGFDLCLIPDRGRQDPKVISAVTSHSIWKREVEVSPLVDSPDAQRHGVLDEAR